MTHHNNAFAVRFADPDYVNWIKAVHCFRHFRDGIKGTVTNVAKRFYDEQLWILNNKPCHKSKWDCTCSGCKGFASKIKEYHRNKTEIDRGLKKNIDYKKWMSQDKGPWEVAKIFMGKGLQKKTSANHTDASNLITFIDNCKYFEKVLNKTPDYEKQLKENLTKTKQFRNELMHSGNLKVKNEVLTKEKERMIATLSTFFEKYDEDAKLAVNEIQKLCYEDLSNLPKENQEKAKQLETGALIEKMEELEHRMKNVEANVLRPELLSELAKVIEFVNKNQDLKNQLDQKLNDFNTKIDHRLGQLQGDMNDMRDHGESSSIAIEDLQNQMTEIKTQMEALNRKSDASVSDDSEDYGEFDVENLPQGDDLPFEKYSLLISDSVTIEHEATLRLPHYVMKMLILNRKLFCLCAGCVIVYDHSTGEMLTLIEVSSNSALSMAITSSRQLLIATYSEGLLQYDLRGQLITCVNIDLHYDVIATGDEVLALRSGQRSRIMWFDKYNRSLERTHFLPTQVKTGQTPSFSSAVSNGFLYISSMDDNCIYQIDLQSGATLEKYFHSGKTQPDPFHYLCVCCTDNQCLLLADKRLNSLQLFNCQTSVWQKLNVEGIERPTAAIVDGAGRLFVAGENQQYCPKLFALYVFSLHNHDPSQYRVKGHLLSRLITNLIYASPTGENGSEPIFGYQLHEN